jgi:hypothetical protein
MEAGKTYGETEECEEIEGGGVRGEFGRGVMIVMRKST